MKHNLSHSGVDVTSWRVAHRLRMINQVCHSHIIQEGNMEKMTTGFTHRNISQQSELQHLISAGKSWHCIGLGGLWGVMRRQRSYQPCTMRIDELCPRSPSGESCVLMTRDLRRSSNNVRLFLFSRLVTIEEKSKSSRSREFGVKMSSRLWHPALVVEEKAYFTPIESLVYVSMQCKVRKCMDT